MQSALLAEIVTIGDELCRGEIVDSNSAWLAARLWEESITVAWITSCRDDPADMRRVLVTASERADVVLTSGGLGPTDDDLTVDIVSELCGVEPESHAASHDKMMSRASKAGYALTPNHARQVRAPSGANVYVNPVGSAPGFRVELGGTPLFSMPGPPRELRGIFETGVAPALVEIREGRGEAIERLAKVVYRVFGRGESQVQHALDGLDLPPRASLHFQVKFPEILVKVVVRHRDQESADELLAGVDADVRARMGVSLYGVGDDSLAAALGRVMTAQDATVAVAESCTGGMLGSLITDVAGSSAFFVGGAVTYSNAEKVRQLGVKQDTLDEHGAVSEACVVEMAAGIRERTGATFAAAVSGIAGPGGGTPDKPVGTVWIAIDGPSGGKTKRFVWPGRRDQVRSLAAHWALSMLRVTAQGPGSDR